MIRSLLFAPAVRQDFLRRLPERGADAVVIDCEDATPPGAKADGRAIARRLGAELAAAGAMPYTRVNGVDTEWFAADVTEGLAPELAGILVPMVETVGGVETVVEALDAAGFSHLSIIAGLETGLGVADARQLLTHPRITGAYFGAEDYIADLGGRRTTSNVEVLVARSAVALAGRLAGVPVLDQVVTDFRDDDRFTAEADEACSMGFAGKLCIHPNQVPLANAAFTPTEEELARAVRLIEAYEAASASGIAAIDFEGQMVDEPVATQARRLIDRAP